MYVCVHMCLYVYMHMHVRVRVCVCAFLKLLLHTNICSYIKSGHKNYIEREQGSISATQGKETRNSIPKRGH